jgi:FMN-dependent NADH-azoreductase
VTRILHIIGSPRTTLSASRGVTEAYVSAYKARSPDVEVDVLDVWRDKMPEFNDDVMNAKYAALHGLERTPAQKEAWEAIAPLAERIRNADILVIGVPMWNFGIPWRLKLLIDVVSQKDYLFRFDAVNGFSGMAKGRAVVVCARGINYASGSDTPESEFDFQKRYMLIWLKSIGIEDVDTIVMEELLFGSEQFHRAREDAKRQAEALAISHTA